MSNIQIELLNAYVRQVLKKKVKTKGGDLGSITLWGTLGRGECTESILRNTEARTLRKRGPRTRLWGRNQRGWRGMRGMSESTNARWRRAFRGRVSRLC